MGSMTRKQPKIYEVPAEKLKKQTNWMSKAGDTRAAAQIAKIPKLLPGEEEYRLRE